MTTKPHGSPARHALWIAPIVLVIVGFFAAIPWLKQQNDSFVLALGAAFAIFVMGYAHFISYKFQRGLDEVQIASQGFANARGWVWGATATILLLLLPPVTDWLVDLANMLSTGSPDMSDRRAVQLAFIGGVCLVVMMQTLGVFVAAAIWWRRMRGMRERS